LLLAFKIVVECAFGKARFFHDVFHGYFLVAFLEEESEGYVDDMISGIVHDKPTGWSAKVEVFYKWCKRSGLLNFDSGQLSLKKY
jgi:hypothetical protein